VAKVAPDALLVSASAASPPASIARDQSPLAEVASRAGLGLILAGGGSWKTDPAAKRVITFKELREALA
jgi:hypothetical protein